MTSHIWGEEFDWKALDDAGQYIEKNCLRWARFGVHTKEKYGTLRVSTTVAYWNYWPVYGLFYPGHCSYNWPGCLIRYMEYPIAKVTEKLGIMRIVNRYQTAVLKFFWKRAAKKWPHIAEEILDEFCWEFENE
jgi:hypothetical protein